MSTDEIIQEAQALPPEERAVVVDSLLRSFHRPDPAVERQWATLAKERLAEYRAGQAETVSFNELLTGLRHRFSQE